MKKFPSKLAKLILEKCSEKEWRTTELADELGYTRPATSRRISELKELGLIKKPYRTSPITTTEKGRKFLYNCENKTDKAIVEAITKL